MEFVNQYLSDDCISTIEEMFHLHISKDYKEVRNIILGFDSKKGRWVSKYGEILATKEIIKFEKLPIRSFFSTSIDNFVKNDSMIFYDDEIFQTVRIHMDDIVKRILDSLFTLSKNVVEYRYITDIIVTEYNMKNAMKLYKNGVDVDVCGELHLRPIEVKEATWKEFKSIIRYKELMMRDAFKLATIDFLENRTDMIKGRHYG